MSILWVREHSVSPRAFVRLLNLEGEHSRSREHSLGASAEHSQAHGCYGFRVREHSLGFRVREHSLRFRVSLGFTAMFSESAVAVVSESAWVSQSAVAVVSEPTLLSFHSQPWFQSQLSSQSPLCM